MFALIPSLLQFLPKLALKVAGSAIQRKLRVGEPYFVLRAGDETADVFTDAWAVCNDLKEPYRAQALQKFRRLKDVYLGHEARQHLEKFTRAEGIATAMMRWPDRSQP